MKISGAIVGALLVGSTVAGCGGSGDNSGSAYCGDIKKANKDFSALDAGDFSKLDKAFQAFHKLAGEAPSKIKPDWKILETAISAMEKGFADAGIKFSDLADLQKGKVPEGVDISKLSGLSATMSKFSDAKFKTASDNIAKHAKSVCKVDVNG